MTIIKYERPIPTQFTYYGLRPAAIMQLKEFSRMERDTAEAGDGLNSLVERKICKPTGEFRVNRLEAQTLVSDAYREGWHEKF